MKDSRFSFKVNFLPDSDILFMNEESDLLIDEQVFPRNSPNR